MDVKTEDQYAYRIRNFTQTKEVDKIIKEIGAEHVTNMLWICLLNTGKFSLASMEKYKEYINWEWACITYNMTPQFLEKMSGYIDWGAVSYFQNLPLDFIKKHASKLNFMAIKRRLMSTGYDMKILKYINKEIDAHPEKIPEWESIAPPFFSKDRSSSLVSVVNIDKATRVEDIKENNSQEDKPKRKSKSKVEKSNDNKSEVKPTKSKSASSKDKAAKPSKAKSDTDKKVSKSKSKDTKTSKSDKSVKKTTVDKPKDNTKSSKKSTKTVKTDLKSKKASKTDVIEEKPKRKRRTKAEMEAARLAEAKNKKSK